MLQHRGGNGICHPVRRGGTGYVIPSATFPSWWELRDAHKTSGPGLQIPARSVKYQASLALRMSEISMPSPEPNQVVHQLDRMPKPLAIALGLPLGVGLALAVLSMPLVFGAVAFASLLGLAGFIAWSGEPVSVSEPEQPPQPTEAPKPEPTRQPETPEAKTPPVPDPLWVNIPGGSFEMGSDEKENERPVHTVHLSPFQLMRTPVTRKRYLAIMGKDPGWPEGKADERPVNGVSWLDAVAFCNRWSTADGLKPCYQIDGDKVTWEPDADGYRLPTEAEWEYACRAGSTTRWYFGDNQAKLAEYAWFYKNSGGNPHPVATRKPNDWGLFDMHGNVWEWCWDWYKGYDKAEQTDPVGLADGSSRVLRGGSFFVGPVFLRSAVRGRYGPELRFRFNGFRCARGPRRKQ